METREEIIAEIDKLEDFPGNMAENVIDNPQSLPTILDKVYLEIERGKLDSINLLLIISRKEPKILYSNMDFFMELINISNGIIMRYVIEIITNFSAVDSTNKINDIFEKFYNLLFERSLVTATYVIDNSWKIVKNRPDLQKNIINELLKLENAPRNEKHQNILLGKVILSFDKYFDEIQDKEEVVLFVKKQLENPRNATRVKAERFLRKYSL